MTDAGGPPPGSGRGGSDDAGFEFDLGGALARLAGDDDPSPNGREARGDDRVTPTVPISQLDTSRDARRDLPPEPPSTGQDPTSGALPTREPSTGREPASAPPAPPATNGARPQGAPQVSPPPPAGASGTEPLPARQPSPPEASAGEPLPTREPVGRQPGPESTRPASPVGPESSAPAQPPASSPAPPRPPVQARPPESVPSQVAPEPAPPRPPAQPVHSQVAPQPTQPTQPVHSQVAPQPTQPAQPVHSQVAPQPAQPAQPVHSQVAPQPAQPAQPVHSQVAPQPTQPSQVAPHPSTEPPGPVEAPAETRNYPRRVPGTHFDAQQRPQPAPEPPAAVIDATSHVQRQSVFDDGASTADPMLPMSAHAAPASSANGSGQLVVDGNAPILPDAPPAAPAVTEPVTTAPANNDITALRSAKLRANRQQKQGRLFGRSLLAFVIIGSVLGAGLYFGRSLLFPTDWDAALTPVVNELQDSSGVEFDGTVPLVALDATTYATDLGAATIGADWVDRVPEWRALGLAEGDVTAESVGAVLARTATAFYDPETDTIYRSEAVAPIEADLRIALLAALDHRQSQQDTSPEGEVEGSADATVTSAPEGTADIVVVAPNSGPDSVTVGLTGVSPLPTIATRSVDRLLAVGGVTARQPAPEQLPLPIAYEIVAVDLLGAPILTAADVEASSLTAGGPYPDSVTGALDDRPTAAASGQLQPGDAAIAEAVALGNDDWSLVWGVRLPTATVDALLTQVVADSYRPIQRNGTVCFVGVFQAADDAAGAAVLSAMQSWVANSPAASQAVATSLGPARVQLEACDPGQAEVTAPNPTVVDALVDRQQLRLTN